MSQTTENANEDASSSRELAAFKPLLEAANRNLFRKNSFRVTGLHVDATVREVARHGDGLLMRAELEQDPHSHASAFPIKPPPNLEDIREAIQRLKTPEQRLIDEFFWFWPEEFGDSRSDPALSALAQGDSKVAIEIWSTRERTAPFSVTAKHNLAIVYFVHALDWENHSIKHENDVGLDRREKIAEYWRKSLNRWERLFEHDQFWEIVAERIRQIDEPSLTTGVSRRMRAALPQAVIKINAELAVEFAEAGKEELARLHVEFMRESSRGREIFDKTVELVLTPHRSRLNDQNHRAKAIADENPAKAHEAARAIIEHTLPMLGLFDLFYGEDEHLQKEIFDESARTAVNCLVAYQRATGDNATFVDLLERAMPLTTSSELIARIRKNIGIGQSVITLQPVRKLCSAAEGATQQNPTSGDKEAEGILAASGSLIEALAKNDVSEESREQVKDEIALAVMRCTIAFGNKTKEWRTCVGLLERAQRLAASSEVEKQIAANLATVRSNTLHMGLKPISSAPSLKTVNGVGVTLYGETDLDPATGSYLSTYYFVFLFVPVFPLARYRVTRNGNGYRFFGKAPLRPFDKWHLAISLGMIVWTFSAIALSSNSSSSSGRSTYTQQSQPTRPAAFTPPPPSEGSDIAGKTYRVPRSVSYTLDLEKAQIEADRTKLQAMQAQIEQLGREIERERSFVDNTSQFAIDQFNAKVQRFNSLNDQSKIAVADFNLKVNVYNAKLNQYGR